MRAPADLVAEPWACREHDDTAQQHVLDVAGHMKAEAEHRELTAAAPQTYDEPPRERRYRLRPSPRLDPEWTPADA